MSVYADIAKAESENREFSVVTVVATSGSTAREAGAMMLVYPDGSISGTVGGGILERQAKIDAKDCIRTGKPLLKEYEIVAGDPKGDTVGGKVTCFLQPHKAANKLYLLGAGHVAQELIPLAKLAGFYVTVIDPRESLSKTGRAGEADEFILAEYSVIDTMDFDPGCYFMIGTYDHAIDGELLGKALRTDAKYVGMLGGKPKIRAIFKKLREEGLDDTVLKKAHTPAGLDIGGQTPAQIALSVAAELLAVSEGKDGGFCCIPVLESLEQEGNGIS